MYKQLSDLDWDEWAPQDNATLLFVVQDEKILLIRKKRGLGAGKINGPGGRLEGSETPLECAVRETEEELFIQPSGITGYGQLDFQFTNGYSLRCFVFRADEFTGDPTETDEAEPLWFNTKEIPYNEMWEDDRIWLPLLLQRQSFSGQFIFDDDEMLDHRLTTD
ncbi:MAG: 8-oxo-dGTP diphosphatase [Pseudomonadota bacterium]